MSEFLVTLRIDGKEVSVPAGTLVVDAAKQIGIDIPVFCYHPKMEPVGMCRMCLVEVGMPRRDRQSGDLVLDEHGAPIIEFRPKLETSCTMPVSEGMVVQVSSEKAVRGRKDIVEFLLTSHPLDCPICDKGGECPLQNLTMRHGPGKSRYLYDEKMQLDKHLPLGDLIYLDQERCIQCARCIRFQEQVVDDPVLEFEERGRKLQIVTYSDPGFDSYFSGNTTDICPVGALTTADFRFGARPWELNATASICPHCPVGCNLTLNTRREASAGGRPVVKRVMPRQNEAVNEIWICDKGRFAHHYASSKQRLTHPLVRKGEKLEEASWEVALKLAADGLKSAGHKTLGIVGGRASNEDLYVFKGLVEGLGGRAVLHDTIAGGQQAGIVGVGSGTNLKALGEGDTILVIASDLHEEAPIWWQRVINAVKRGASLVVANARSTRLDAYATHILRFGYGEALPTAHALLSAVSGKKSAAKKGAEAPLLEAARSLKEAQNLIVFMGGEGLDYAGSDALADACASLLSTTKHAGRQNNGLIVVWSKSNLQGAWDLGLRGEPDGLNEAIGGAQAIITLAADPFGDEPALAGEVPVDAFIVVQELFLTETAKRADVVFPALSFVEREGTFTSGERRVQRFHQALTARGGAHADWEILSELSGLLELGLQFKSEREVFGQIADSTSGYDGLTYDRLAETAPQWPPVGSEDLYFGGTAFKNLQGLGVQIPAALERGETFNPVDGKPNGFPQSEWVLIPITELYDRGRTVTESRVLEPRLEPAALRMNAADAEKLGVEPGGSVALHLDAKVHNLPVRVDSSVPTGFVLLGRSQGIPVSAPIAVEIKPVS